MQLLKLASLAVTASFALQPVLAVPVAKANPEDFSKPVASTEENASKANSKKKFFSSSNAKHWGIGAAGAMGGKWIYDHLIKGDTTSGSSSASSSDPAAAADGTDSTGSTGSSSVAAVDAADSNPAVNTVAAQ